MCMKACCTTPLHGPLLSMHFRHDGPGNITRIDPQKICAQEVLPPYIELIDVLGGNRGPGFNSPSQGSYVFPESSSVNLGL
ncbi:hypothetical protein BDV26DRAFT_261993 [Aspergillus bertholletiae]|uniref:Uncharacterized protein n=1 Tax=Aspergillus bertholletiae TaxID=1226010 RepID=A0A5N7B8Z8_9EURO|nr:hypothetical protein BDV26DRAFT_261993 [Aspergillus bertholletiae]